MKFLKSSTKATISIAVIVTFCLQMLLYNTVSAQLFNFSRGIKKDAIQFKKIKNVIIVPLTINDKGPYNFILDTGVDPLIITDTTIVKDLDLGYLRPVKINGIGEGMAINALFSNAASVSLGRAKIDNIPAVILSEDAFNLSNYLGTKIHGIIGYYFFNSFVVTINYANDRLIFNLPNPKQKIKGTKIDLELIENKPYINTTIKVDSLGEIKAKLIVDCGANHALSLEAYEGNIFPLPTTTIKGNLGIGLAGEINGSIGRVKNIKLGDYMFKNVITNFPNYSDVGAKTNRKERTGNIGADLLRRFLVTFDYQNRKMYLKKSLNYSYPFEHDMSGMEIYAFTNDYNRFFISRIEPASPAEKAGFSINDEVLSINFKAIESLTLEQITNLLKSGDGNTVIIEVVRDQKVLIKILHLKRRI